MLGYKATSSSATHGHDDSLMRELPLTTMDMYRNLLCLDEDLYNEIIECAQPHLQKEIGA